MKTRQAFRILIAPLAVTLLLTASGVTLADDITVDGFEFKNIRITGLREGQLYFIGPAGERSADLARIKGLKLSSYPELEKADAAIAKKDYRTAAGVLEQVFKRLDKDYLQLIVGSKLVYCLDKSDQFERALVFYVQLLSLDTSPFVQGIKPTNMPSKEAEQKALQSRVEALLRSATTLEAKQYLGEINDALKEGKKIEVDPTTPQSGLVDAAEARRDVVGDFIKEGKFDDALKTIDKQIDDRGVSLSKLLFQRGQALEGSGKDMDALESYMRVIVHYEPRQTDFYVPALVEAGKVFKKLGKTDHARNLWTEARKLIGDDKENRDAAKEVQDLLGSLSQ
ncbi:MAG: hypothetical protein GC159_14720 [Phycisphaera sp.]|nr:hypothetical protein [Phycisphaera sp.]